MNFTWHKEQLSNIVESFHQGLNTAGQKINFYDTGYPIIQTRNLNNGMINLDKKIKYMSKEDWETYKDKYRPKLGDVFFTNIGTIGKTAIVTKEEDYLIHWNIFKFRPITEKLSSSFFKCFLDYLVDSNYFSRLQKGGTVNFVTKKMLNDILVPIPPLPEQQRIVSILDEAFTAIDQAIANTEKNLANARELFESYLNNVFTLKGDGWVDKTLGEICENLDSKRIPITKAKRVSGDIPYYGASGIVDHVAEFIFNEPLLLVSEDGANLLARTYPIAFSIDGKTWVNNHAHALRFKSMVTQRFVEYFLNSISLDPYVSGMAQPKLNQKSLNSIMVPLPDLSEQELIISNLARLQTETKKLDDLYKAKVVGLTELKQSILQKAFSGELTSEDIKQQVNG